MRVAITSMGVVSAHGAGVAALETALREGKSGVRPVTQFDTTGLCSNVAAEAPVQTSGDRARGLLELAATEALTGRDLLPSLRRGVIVATTKGQLPAVLSGERDDPF